MDKIGNHRKQVGRRTRSVHQTVRKTWRSDRFHPSLFPPESISAQVYGTMDALQQPPRWLMNRCSALEFRSKLVVHVDWLGFYHCGSSLPRGDTAGDETAF